MSAEDHRALRATLRQQGCFKRRPVLALLAVPANVLGAFALFYAASQLGLWGAPLFLAGSVVYFRLAWLMHEGAHGAIFGVPRADRTYSLFVCAFLGGFPAGWSHGHNRHHAAPNVRGIDGDQSERWNPASRNLGPTQAAGRIFLVRRVAGVMLPRSVLMLWLRDALYAKRHVPQRFPADLAAGITAQALQITAFVWLFGPWWALPLYAVHTHIGLVYLNAIFVGNHYDLASFDAGEHRDIDHAHLQVITARNYPPTPWIRWLCGGLEYQIEHHLFPDLPRHGLPKAAPHVRAWCEARGLPYEELGLVASWRRAIAFHGVAEEG